jgi:hypothetical protein
MLTHPTLDLLHNLGSMAWPKASSRSNRPPRPEQLNAEQRRDLLEIVEDRYDSRSILITSQLPSRAEFAC